MTKRQSNEWQGWTIDGRFAEVLDDALWVEQTGAGEWTVRAYVARPEILERAEVAAAFERGIAAYGTAGRIPLWRAATEKRFSLSLGTGSRPAWLIEIGARAAAGSREMFEFDLELRRVAAVRMRSSGRLSYADADALLERRRARRAAAAGEYFGEFWLPEESLRGQLDFLGALARQLAAARRQAAATFAGAPGTEKDWELTEDGVWRELAEEERGGGYLIVRETMIAVNRLLAEWSAAHGIEILYRNQSRRQPAARYEIGNAGHGALGYTTYAHFTSPLRRAADFLNWAAVADYLEKRENAESRGGKETEARLPAMKRATGRIEEIRRAVEAAAPDESIGASGWLTILASHLSQRERAVREATASSKPDETISDHEEWRQLFSRERLAPRRADFFERNFARANETARAKFWKYLLKFEATASDNELEIADPPTELCSAVRAAVQPLKTPENGAGKLNHRADKIKVPAKGIRWTRQKGDGSKRQTVEETIKNLMAGGEFGIGEAFGWLFYPPTEKVIIKANTDGSDDKTNDGKNTPDEIKRETILKWAHAEWGRARRILELGRQKHRLYLEIEDIEPAATADFLKELASGKADGTYDADDSKLVADRKTNALGQETRSEFCVRIGISIKRSAAEKPAGEIVPVADGCGIGKSKAAAREAAARNVLAALIGAEAEYRLPERAEKILAKGAEDTIMNESKAERNGDERAAARENHLARGGNFVGWLNETVQRLKLAAPNWIISERKLAGGRVSFEVKLDGALPEQLRRLADRPADPRSNEETDSDDRKETTEAHVGIGATKSVARQIAARSLWESFCKAENSLKRQSPASPPDSKERQVVIIPTVERENYVAAVLEWLQMFAPGETLEFSVRRAPRRELTDDPAPGKRWFRELVAQPGAPEDKLWVAELTNIPPIEGSHFRAAHQHLKHAKQMVAAEVYDTLRQCAAPKDE